MFSLIPICPNSTHPATTFCHSQNCQQQAFCCSVCPNQHCLLQHRHKVRQVKFWVQVQSEIQKLMAGFKDMAPADPHFKKIQIQIQEMITSLRSLSQSYHLKISETQRAVKLKPAYSEIIEKLRRNNSVEVTGEDMHKFIQGMENGDLYQGSERHECQTKAETERISGLLRMATGILETYGREEGRDSKLLQIEEEMVGKPPRRTMIMQEVTMEDVKAKKSLAYSTLMGRSSFIRGGKQSEIKKQKSGELRRSDFYMFEKSGENDPEFIQQNMKLIEKYNKALLQKPDEAVYLYNLGCCYHNLKNYDKAIANFEMAIKLDQTNPGFYNGRALSYLSLKEYKLALQDFFKSKRLDPTYPKYHANRGYCQYFLGNYEQSISDFSTAFYLSPFNAQYLFAQSLCYQALGDYVLALQKLQRAIALDPTKPQFLNQIGNVHMAMKQYSKAIKYYDQAIRQDECNALYQANKADACYALAVENEMQSQLIMECAGIQGTSSKIY